MQLMRPTIKDRHIRISIGTYQSHDHTMRTFTLLLIHWTSQARLIQSYQKQKMSFNLQEDFLNTTGNERQYGQPLRRIEQNRKLSMHCQGY